MLEFKVSGQTLTRIDSFRPAEKSRGYLTAKFCLSSDEWKSGTLEARVKNRQDVVVYEAEIINGQCLIPWEALAKSGVMQISVFMKNGDVEITTNFVDVGISSTLPSGTESNPPTPSELDQIKQQISDLSERVDNLNQGGGDVDLTGYATEEWVKGQNYLTEVPEGYAKTEDIPTDEHIIELIEENAPESSGGIAVIGAKVGQTIKIAEVDENGVPTAWESVELPSSGSGCDKYKLLATVEPITEAVRTIEVSIIEDGITEVYLVGKAKQAEQTGYDYVTILLNSKASCYNTGIPKDYLAFLLYHGLLLEGGHCLSEISIGQYETNAQLNALKKPQSGFDGYGEEIKKVSLMHSHGNGLLDIGTCFDVWGR